MPGQDLTIPDSENSDLDNIAWICIGGSPTESEVTDSLVGSLGDAAPSTKASPGSESAQAGLAAAGDSADNSQHQSPVPSEVGSVDSNQSVPNQARGITDGWQGPPPIGPTDSQIVEMYNYLRADKQNCDLYDWGFSDAPEEGKDEILQGQKDYVEKYGVEPAEKWTFFWMHYTFQHLCRDYKDSHDVQDLQAFATRVYSILRVHCDTETPATSRNSK